MPLVLQIDMFNVFYVASVCKAMAKELSLSEMPHRGGGGGHKCLVSVPVGTSRCMHWFGVSEQYTLFVHRRWGNVFFGR